MRRRPKSFVTDDGSTYPENLVKFVGEDWPGKIDWDRYAAWMVARKEWEKRHLGDGVFLPVEIGAFVPDEPFDPYSV